MEAAATFQSQEDFFPLFRHHGGEREKKGKERREGQPSGLVELERLLLKSYSPLSAPRRGRKEGKKGVDRLPGAAYSTQASFVQQTRTEGGKGGEERTRLVHICPAPVEGRGKEEKEKRRERNEYFRLRLRLLSSSSPDPSSHRPAPVAERKKKGRKKEGAIAASVGAYSKIHDAFQVFTCSFFRQRGEKMGKGKKRGRGRQGAGGGVLFLGVGDGSRFPLDDRISVCT